MSRRLRMIYFLLAVFSLLVIGRWATGTFEFVTGQFWFTSGLFLAILLSLVDQPHFSKDANVFVNAVTGWVALLTVRETQRDDLWQFFFWWTCYLIISGGALIWTRVRELEQEHPLIQAVSRLNREIGKPMTLFSAFFLWGLFRQFSVPSPQFDTLLLFWVVFFLANLPAISRVFDQWLATHGATSISAAAGVVSAVVSPSLAEIAFSLDASDDLVGKSARLQLPNGKHVADAVIIEDRILRGHRVGRAALTALTADWHTIADEDRHQVLVEICEQPDAATSPISVVDTGSSVGALNFSVAPSLKLQIGEVVWSETPTERAFYQIINAKVEQHSTDDGNVIQRVGVVAGQLGVWDPEACRFEPVPWVAKAGNVIQVATGLAMDHTKIPKLNEIIGHVPNSDFPIHVNLDDIVTHNTAVLGVTGSGKSYLAFHLIESMVARGIRVMVLDISRQHYSHLQRLKPFALKKAANVPEWLDSDSPLGIHAFAVDEGGFPTITAQFIDEAFGYLSAKIKLRPGRNEPAHLCVVLEEAHSLIPEWNQVSQKGDEFQVNKAARTILQGRKFGIGALVITQRTANVTKTILNQCNTIFALQSFDQTGLDFLKNYMGDQYAHSLSTLRPRQAVLVGKASSSTRPVIVDVTDFTGRWAENGKEEVENGRPLA